MELTRKHTNAEGDLMRRPAADARMARRALCCVLLLAVTGAGAETSWQVETEPVALIRAFDGNIASVWGYHQPLIVRARGTVFCVLLEPYGDGFAQQWSLYERDDAGWRQVWSTPQDAGLNQPPSITAEADGTLHVVAWPGGRFTHYRFDPGSDEPVVEMPSSSPYDDLWPYAGSAVNADGELLVVASAYEQNLFAVHTGAGWRRGRVARHPEAPASPSAFDRQAYPFVALAGRAAHVFTTQDIADPDKIAADVDFVYSFRNLQYYYTPDILSVPFTRTEVANVEATGGWAHNDDLLIDGRGRVHLLYRVQAREGDWGDTRLMHAFGAPGGPLTHVQLGGSGEFNLGRLWESPEGGLYATLPRYTDLYVARLGADGGLAEEPVDLGIRSTGWNFSGRVFLAATRASAAGAPALEGLYFRDADDRKIVAGYFHATPTPSTAVTGSQPTGFRLRLDPPFPNPFNAATVIRFETAAGTVSVDILNAAGQHVRTLVSGQLEGGAHEATWSGRDDLRRTVAAGTYLLRLRADGRQRQQKVIYLK